MVDFNSQATISTPPGDILKIAILERRAYFINAHENYVKLDAQLGGGGIADIHVVRAAIVSLFLELEPALKKSMLKPDDKKLFEAMENVVFSQSATLANCLSVFRDINAWLYEKNLTKFDTRKEVDGSDLEAVNVNKGL